MELLNSASGFEVIASLSHSYQSAMERAERTIARGLKCTLEVGMALKEIRDKRLYLRSRSLRNQRLLSQGLSAVGLPLKSSCANLAALRPDTRIRQPGRNKLGFARLAS